MVYDPRACAAGSATSCSTRPRVDVLSLVSNAGLRGAGTAGKAKLAQIAQVIASLKTGTVQPLGGS